MKPLFELKNVKYGVYIDIPELLIEDNKITTLIGPSGSGKTTILKILNKMLSPTHGQVLFKGQDLNNLQSIEHRRKVVMFSQNPVVFDGSVRDNLNAGLIFQEKEPAESSKLKYALELVKLDKPLDSSASKLSGGEKQRLTLARVMLLNPDIYLLDEPSSSLDDDSAYLVYEMLTHHSKKETKAMVLVTHSKAIADKYSDMVIRVAPGGIIARIDKNERNN